MFKGLANLGDTGGYELWGKCTTSAECKTDISVVLDPHMIIEFEKLLTCGSLVYVLVPLCFLFLSGLV